uniref:Uncharacterized protein n=1 Tax=Anguilla anguilla TaxID=7936 RepID=A0A0E9TJS9_ANGAN
MKKKNVCINRSFLFLLLSSKNNMNYMQLLTWQCSEKIYLFSNTYRNVLHSKKKFWRKGGEQRQGRCRLF